MPQDVGHLSPFELSHINAHLAGIHHGFQGAHSGHHGCHGLRSQRCRADDHHTAAAERGCAMVFSVSMPVMCKTVRSPGIRLQCVWPIDPDHHQQAVKLKGPCWVRYHCMLWFTPARCKLPQAPACMRSGPQSPGAGFGHLYRRHACTPAPTGLRTSCQGSHMHPTVRPWTAEAERVRAALLQAGSWSSGGPGVAAAAATTTDTTTDTTATTTTITTTVSPLDVLLQILA